MIDISEGFVVPKEGLYDSDGYLKVVPFIHPKDGCSYWRIRKPFEYMGVDLYNDSRTIEETLEHCKIVTFNRSPGINIKKFLEMKVRYGFKVVVDWDDCWDLPHDHLIYKGWIKEKMPELSKGIVTDVADYVTVTTERLAVWIRQFNKNVTVIPNSIPFNDAQWIDQERVYGAGGRELTKSGRVVDNYGTRFGYVAGSSHLPDLKSIEYAIQHFPQIKLTLCGYDNPGEKIGQKNVWDSMERIASNNYTNPNYRRIKTRGFDDYALAYDNIDVAIAPLKTNVFNTYKSSLKAYEAGAKKVALICSLTAPYTDDIPDDCATFCANIAEWKDAIKKHKDLSFVEDQAAKLHEWVKANRSMEKISQDRIEFFNSIM
jgi:hypothetical protein